MSAEYRRVRATKCTITESLAACVFGGIEALNLSGVIGAMRDNGDYMRVRVYISLL